MAQSISILRLETDVFKIPKRLRYENVCQHKWNEMKEPEMQQRTFSFWIIKTRRLSDMVRFDLRTGAQRQGSKKGGKNEKKKHNSVATSFL